LSITNHKSQISKSTPSSDELLVEKESQSAVFVDFLQFEALWDHRVELDSALVHLPAEFAHFPEVEQI